MSSPSAKTAAGESPNLRVFFIPFFASGHLIPMLDLARAFASRPGVEPTLVVTPANAALLHPPSSVSLLTFPFPTDAGLPAGAENLTAVSAADEWRIDAAVDLARPAIESLLRLHRPHAVVSDIHFWWTTAIAADLGIPRVTSHHISVFSQCVMRVLLRLRTHDAAERFVIPELPGPNVEMVRSELPKLLRSKDHLAEAWEDIKKAQMECFGDVVNTCYEVEGAYCEMFKKTEGKKLWSVGPLALAYGGDGERGRGGGAHRCLKWLDDRNPESVVFVCFGSWCRFTTEQLREMATGLDACGCHFLWVVRNSTGASTLSEEEWMPAGWEKRIADRGMVVRGWAPQVAILGHRAVGAFLTHCGWNSVLEAVMSGVPMLTWPLAFDHFICERLVVGLMGSGARLWDGARAEDESERTVVPADAIARAVSRFMETGGEGEAARKSVREYAARTEEAVAEGGSSYRDLNCLIDELMATAEH